MPGTQNAPAPYRAATFDDQGNDADPGIADDVIDPNAPAADDAALDDAAPGPAAADPNAKMKYRIGDKEFATADEAHAFATSHISTLETERQLADAYRQGIQDGVRSDAPAPGVTPAVPAENEFDEQLYYADPAAFLKQFASQITNQVTTSITQTQAMKEASDRIWSDFSRRHPDLADFRNEVEGLAAQHLPELKVVNQTKGQPAGFDFIAMKVRSNFQRYAQAMKPSRQLANGKGGGSPSGTSGVTPKVTAKKPLSFQEQVRSIRPKRR